MKTYSKIISAVAGCAVGTVVVSSISFLSRVIKDASENHRDDCEYLMVLGGNVLGADTPSPQLLARMKSAAEYLKENTECFVIPCGGCFRPEQKKSEAKIIADYLIGQGVDEKRLILEDKSTTTFENFEFALKIIENHSQKSISQVNTAFLSSDYHIFRASKIAECCGFDKIGKVSSPTAENKASRYLRELTVSPELSAKLLKKRFLR